MHKVKYLTIHAKDNPMDVCQVAERFWIPHELVKNEEDVPTLVTIISTQEVSLGAYKILNINIWDNFRELG